MKPPKESSTPSPSVVIIGCGFGGIALAIALKKAGIEDFRILERAADIGGVWRDNSYPGAACDVVSRLYSFSFEQSYPWSSAFAPRDEIYDYVQGIADKYDVRRHVTFNTEVTSATFDERIGRWTVNTKSGETLVTPVLVSAVGLFNQPNMPAIAGRDEFKGVHFHSARWNHDYPLAGKTVAVIGTGASAVQFIPKIAAVVDKLYVYQRSAQYVFPKTLFPGTSEWDAWLGRRRWLRWLARLKIYLMFERFIYRRRRFPDARLKGEEGFRKLLEAKVKDPVLRAKLTPDYPMGCKRQLVSDEWYKALTRPNVEVVDTPIEALVPDGVRTTDGTVRPADAVVYGTGFTPTDYLTPMRVTGQGGRELNQAWRDGAEAYLGIAVSGFPNFFMLYGPNTNAVASIIFMLECQARYIVDAIRTLRRKGARTLTVRENAQNRFIEEMTRRLAKTVPAMAICHTYFKTESGRITTQWPGYATEYRWRTRAVQLGDYDLAYDAPAAQAAE